MKLDRDTYEAWLLDRLEGRLTPAQEAQLDAFLRAHPALDPGEGFLPSLEAESFSFPGKERLRKAFPPQGMPDAARLDDFLVARLEGELSGEQEQALERYLARHPGAAHQAALMARTQVAAAPMAYPAKERLKKRAARVVPLWPRLAVAASVLLVLAAGAWWLRAGRHPAPELARVENPKPAVPLPRAAEAAAGTKDAAEAPAPQAAAAEAPATLWAAHKEKPRATAEPRRAAVPEPVAPQPLPEEDALPPAARHQEAPEPRPQLADALPQPAPPQAATAPEGEGQDVATFMANMLRKDVLARPQRSTGLDGDDALALADKAVSAVTGGQGGVAVQQAPGRKKLDLHLGRHFGISASIGR